MDPPVSVSCSHFSFKEIFVQRFGANIVMDLAFFDEFSLSLFFIRVPLHFQMFVSKNVL